MNQDTLQKTITQAAKPLSGLKVIELGQVLSAPFAGSIFADLGAEVIKIERVGTGDDARTMGPPFRGGDALNFHIFNRNKKSVAMNLKEPQEVQKLKHLISEADILIHNLRPGVTQELGLDGITITTQFPKIIYCEISAFGHKGPMSQQPGYEPLIQAYSGLSSTNGGPDDPPIRIGASVCDQGSGMWVVIGALSLLSQRHMTGRGGIVNTSLLETALSWNGQKNDAYMNLGQRPIKHASGHPNFVPYEAFDTLDGPLLICCGNDRLFQKLCSLLNKDSWAEDARFKTNRARIDNKESLLNELVPLLKQKKRDEWLSAFKSAGIPSSAILNIDEVVTQEQVQALEMFQSLPGQDFSLTTLPLSFNGQRPAITSAAPALGQNNSLIA
jgi:formyl-CoA transferase